MVSRPCPIKSNCLPSCPEVSSPYGNLSAEDPDPVDFIAMSYFKSTPGINFNNSSWANTGGVGIGRSTVNQQRADQAAMRNIQLPTWSNQGRGTLPGVGAYGNSSQSTTVDCPGGGSFDYTIPPGTYLGQSQVEADELAASYLDEQALQNLLCINTTEISDACLNQSYSASFSATGGTAPYEWNVTDGALPGGLTLDPLSGEITGTATAAGSFTFTVSVSDQLFNSQSQQFTISVFSIAPSSLPSGTVGTAYSQAITVTPALGSLTVVGTLPDGLTLSGSTISGNPTTKGTYAFSLQVEYGELTCSQSYSLRIWDTDNTIWSADPFTYSETDLSGSVSKQLNSFAMTEGKYEIWFGGNAGQLGNWIHLGSPNPGNTSRYLTGTVPGVVMALTGGETTNLVGHVSNDCSHPATGAELAAMTAAAQADNPVFTFEVPAAGVANIFVQGTFTPVCYNSIPNPESPDNGPIRYRMYRVGKP